MAGLDPATQRARVCGRSDAALYGAQDARLLGGRLGEAGHGEWEVPHKQGRRNLAAMVGTAIPRVKSAPLSPHLEAT